MKGKRSINVLDDACFYFYLNYIINNLFKNVFDQFLSSIQSVISLQKITIVIQHRYIPIYCYFHKWACYKFIKKKIKN